MRKLVSENIDVNMAGVSSDEDLETFLSKLIIYIMLNLQKF